MTRLSLEQRVASLAHHKEFWLLTLVLTLIFVVNLITLDRFPPPFADEAWMASRATGYIETGRIFGETDRYIFDYYDGYWTFLPTFSTFLQSLAIRFLGQPSLFSIRFISLLFSPVLLLAVYWIARPALGKRWAFVVLLLTATSWVFVRGTHFGRVDLIGAALGYSALAIVLNTAKRHFLWGLGAALLSSLAFETHPHTAVIIVGTLAAYPLIFGRSLLKQPHFWAFVLGGIIGLAWYVTVHILPYPQTYLALNRLNFGTTHVPPVVALDVGVLREALRYALTALAGTHLIFDLFPPWSVGLFTGIAFVVMAFQRSLAADKRLVALAAIIFGSYILLISNKISYYSIHFAPIVFMIIMMFLRFLRQKYGREQLFDPLLICVSIITLVIAIYPYSFDSRSSFKALETQLRATIQPTDRIMAPQTYWFALSDHDYYGWESLIYYRKYHDTASVEDAFAEIRPDIFIYDGHNKLYIADTPNTENLYGEYFFIPKNELESFLERYSLQLARIDDTPYGDIAIYRIDWSKYDREKQEN